MIVFAIRLGLSGTFMGGVSGCGRAGCRQEPPRNSRLRYLVEMIGPTLERSAKF
jgi:hypothetical protein